MSLRILISHSHDERPLASAWKTLLETVSNGAIEPWYSSDVQSEGGMEIGEDWRAQLRARIAQSDMVLAVLSPQSRDRPWILWECGVASGLEQERGVIPVVYSMGRNDLANPLSSYQVYLGDARSVVLEICERLARKAGLNKPQPQLWGPAVDEYLAAIAVHRPRRAQRVEDTALWRARAEQLIQSGRRAEVPALRARMYVSLGPDFKPIDAALHEVLSKALLDLTYYEEARIEVDYALSLVEGDVDLLHRRALASAHLHDLKTALDTIGQLVEMDASLAMNPEIAGLEGRVYRERHAASNNAEDLEAARDAYRRAFNVDPSSHYCGVNLGALSLLAGDNREADEVFARVLTMVRKEQAEKLVSYWADFTAGECQLGLGKVDAALEEYRRGIARTPQPSPRDRESALNGVTRIIRARKLGDDVLPQFRHALE